MQTMRSVAMGLLLAAFCAGQEGTRVFISRCIQCHDPNSDSHAPLPEALGNLPWQAILKALETGSMKAIGAQLSAEDKIAVARYLGKAGPAVLPEMKGFCAAGAKPQAGGSSWNGWGVDERNTRFQPAQAAGLTPEQVPKLKLKWAFGFPNTVTAYSQPTVVGGRVYTGSNDGTVYALDAQSGCLYWMYQAKAMVRDAVVIGPGPRAYFGDLESNFYALEADTGQARVAEEAGQPALHAHHRHGNAARRTAVCADHVPGRKCRGQSAVLLLHVSRQSGGGEGRRRKRRLADLHVTGAEAHQEECGRRAVLRPVRRHHLVLTDARSEEKAGIRGCG